MQGQEVCGMHLPFLWDLGEKWGKSVSFAAPSHPALARCRCQGPGSSPSPGEVLHPTGRPKTLKAARAQKQSWKEQSSAQGQIHLSGKGHGELLLAPTLPRASLRAKQHDGARRNEMKKETEQKAGLCSRFRAAACPGRLPHGEKVFFFHVLPQPEQQNPPEAEPAGAASASPRPGALRGKQLPDEEPCAVPTELVKRD